MLKRAGLTFKDLYTEPAKTARLIGSKLVTASGLNARPESIGATLQHGMKGSALDYYGPDAMLQVAIGDVFTAVGRAQAGLAGLEKDPQRRAQFLAAVHLGLRQGLHEAIAEVDRFKTMQKLCTNDEPRFVAMRDTLYQNAAIRPAAGPDALNLAKMMDSFGRPDQVTGEGVAHKDAGPNQIRYSWQDEMDVANAYAAGNKTDYDWKELAGRNRKVLKDAAREEIDQMAAALQKNESFRAFMREKENPLENLEAFRLASSALNLEENRKQFLLEMAQKVAVPNPRELAPQHRESAPQPRELAQNADQLLDIEGPEQPNLQGAIHV